MEIMKLTGASIGIALATVLALTGCSAPEPRTVVVTPPATAVAPGAAPPTFQTEIDVAPMPGHTIRLQSFAGDVCVSDGSGGGFISHCICAERNCTCQGATGNCTP